MSDTLELVGKPVPEGVGRDAVHIAMVPVTTAQILSPGEHVGWVDKDEMTVGRVANTLGVIDPFIRGPIRPNTRVFLFLYPQTITSLKHVWQHPEFPDEVKVVEKIVEVQADIPAAILSARKAEAEKWLRKYCHNVGADYDLLMAAICSPKGSAYERANPADEWDYPHGYSVDGDYITSHGRDMYDNIPDQFWDHAETLFERKFGSRPTHFSCSC
jgi:hypothetical protein